MEKRKAREKKIGLFTLSMVVFLVGCGLHKDSDVVETVAETEVETEAETGVESEVETDETTTAETPRTDMTTVESTIVETAISENTIVETTMSENNIVEATTPENSTQEPQVLTFVDVFQNPYETELNPNITKHTYNCASFQKEGDKLFYNEYATRLGIDVSHHQGNIDWEKVKADGYEFAFLRIAYRGYGESGTLNVDREFHNNINKARQTGMDVGVYIYSQAINEQEALEEAELVLKELKDYQLQLPVVYDPEHVLDAKARTDDISGEQFTKNTIAFCERIKEAGYTPMIYTNMLWQAFTLDMEQLSAYPIWYADYEEKPQTPYDFHYWQYTNTGKVDGVSGTVDINIEMKKAE